MERVRFITHQGKKILLIDYSNLTDETEILQMVEQRESVVDSQPRNSVLTVINVAGAKFTKEVLTRVKEANVYDRPFVRRAALVGVGESQKAAVDAVSMFAKREWGMFETVDQALDWIVNEEADRLSRRVRNLLDMARLEAGALPLENDLCDLTDVVAAALERLGPLLRGRPVDDCFPAEPLYVNADYAQLEMVLINLVENALKYSPPGTPLFISGRATHGDAEIAVRDQGPGVPPGDEERVFQKFYRAAAGRQTAGGTGLGLAICQTIVEAHGGRITSA